MTVSEKLSKERYKGRNNFVKSFFTVQYELKFVVLLTKFSIRDQKGLNLI